jgi:ATP-dependent RNA helicase RhlE
MTFDKLELSPALRRAVADKGYQTTTPIQAKAIPAILSGRDLIGCAQTGTGKTAAFALPTLERVLSSVAASRQEAKLASASGAGRVNSRRKTRCLVLAPTRELASQIVASFAAYGKHSALRFSVVYGGVSQGSQVRSLQHGVDVLVATPGRLLDLMNQGFVSLANIEIAILDEADQMLDMGFLPDLRRIMARVPQKRQTLMFSATMPDAIRKLAKDWLQNPVNIEVEAAGTPVERIDQSVYFVEKPDKAKLLIEWLQNTSTGRTLVFARTKHGADKLVRQLMRSKIKAAAMHGNKSQSARERTLEQFKSKHPPILVATDIAARGIDVKDVSHIVNYDLPEAPEVYVHRIGRTARAGASGAAVSFCSREEVKQLRGIERLMRQQIAVGKGNQHFTQTAPLRVPQSQGSATETGIRRRPKSQKRSRSSTRASARRRRSLPLVAADRGRHGALQSH